MTKTDAVVQGKTPVRAPDGSLLTGAGVGIAIVDTGIDATHPGLLYGDVVVRNLKFVHHGTLELDNTDTTSGHGTAVAGIAGARGHRAAYDGGAPGAGLYGLGAGEFFSIYFALQSYDWILNNHDQVDPPIQVVVNAWGSGTRHDPSSPLTKAIDRMVDEGITVVFAAGNDGGDGFQDRTTAQCNHPREGVVCVGAYRDRSRLEREGDLADTSSRGSRLFQTTWPDLVAPGDRVTTALALTGTTTASGLWLETPSTLYTTLSGTSMAAPMVGAAAAILYQYDPGIEPHEVEWALEQGAYVFDGASGPASTDARWNGATHDRGHGLLDTEAAVLHWAQATGAPVTGGGGGTGGGSGILPSDPIHETEETLDEGNGAVQDAVDDTTGTLDEVIDTTEDTVGKGVGTDGATADEGTDGGAEGTLQGTVDDAVEVVKKVLGLIR